MLGIWDMVHQRCSTMKNEPPHDKTNKMTVCPAKTQISLGICPVWSESSLCAQWVAKDPGFLHADSGDSDQTGRLPRLIWVFARRFCQLVGYVMRQLNWAVSSLPHLENIGIWLKDFWKKLKTKYTHKEPQALSLLFTQPPAPPHPPP